MTIEHSDPLPRISVVIKKARLGISPESNKR